MNSDIVSVMRLDKKNKKDRIEHLGLMATPSSDFIYLYIV